MLSNLGAALQTRFMRTGQRADLDQALQAFRAGAEILTASSEERVPAAQRWGRCALLTGDPGSAAEGYAIAVELLPVMAWHGRLGSITCGSGPVWQRTRQQLPSPQVKKPGPWNCWRPAGRCCGPRPRTCVMT
jgi:hypothetical protein